MTKDNLPSDAAILEAAIRSCLGPANIKHAKNNPRHFPSVIALARMIEKYEPETLVDPDLLVVREIIAAFVAQTGSNLDIREALNGEIDYQLTEALKIYKEAKGD